VGVAVGMTVGESNGIAHSWVSRDIMIFVLTHGLAHRRD